MGFDNRFQHMLIFSMSDRDRQNNTLSQAVYRNGQFLRSSCDRSAQFGRSGVTRANMWPQWLLKVFTQREYSSVRPMSRRKLERLSNFLLLVVNH